MADQVRVLFNCLLLLMNMLRMGNECMTNCYFLSQTDRENVLPSGNEVRLSFLAPIVLEICGGCATTVDLQSALFVCAAGVEHHVPAGQDALEKLETHLRPQGFTIRAFTLDHEDPLFFKSYPREGAKVVDVVLVNGHCMVIKNVARYFNKDYFCNLCCTPFDRRMRHRCGRLCQACKHETCTECQHSEGRTFQCPVCKRYFFGTQCCRRHLDQNGQCPNLWRYCEECHHEYQHDARHAHKCGERYCKVCNAIRPQEQRCFVPVHRFRRLPKPSRSTELRLNWVERNWNMYMAEGILEDVFGGDTFYSVLTRRFNTQFLDDPFFEANPQRLPERLSIYANFVDETWVGEEQKPLLSVIGNPDMRLQESSPSCHVTFRNIGYVKAASKVLTNLRVWIEDEDGNNHGNVRGTTMLVLHFRHNRKRI